MLELLLLGTLILIPYFIFLYFQYRNKYSARRLIKELTELRASENQLRAELNSLQNELQQTVVDPLTKLLGWRLFEDRLQLSIQESKRNHVSCSVIYVDLHDFKMINHALGHEVGDLLLKAVAERLQTCIRQVDSASRLAKDTYVLLLTQLNKPETTVLIAQRILQSLASAFHIKENELYVRVSLGIAVYPADGDDVPTLLRNAEQALFLAKEKNGNNYQFYQQKLQVDSQRELALYSHLNQESLFKELEIYYQPIINVTAGNVFCMDTEIQWQHAEFGLISQQELFNYAFRQRKLNSIIEWALRHTIKQFVDWRSKGVLSECLSMRITTDQLANTHFIYSISKILQDTACQPEWLLLKIVGDLNLVSPDVLEKSFNMLKYLKVKIAIDDFDLSTCSLKQLRAFPINYLILSRFAIEDLHSSSSTEFIKAIMALAHALSIQVISRGVESEEQREALKEMNCELMQGLLFAHPLRANQVSSSMSETIA